MQFSAQWRVFEGITYTSHKIASASAELENTLDSMGWLRGSSFGQGLGPGSIDDFMVDQIFEGLKTALGTLYEAVAETAQMLPLLEPFATQVAADCEHTPPETETSETSTRSRAGMHMLQKCLRLRWARPSQRLQLLMCALVCHCRNDRNLAKSCTQPQVSRPSRWTCSRRSSLCISPHSAALPPTPVTSPTPATQTAARALPAVPGRRSTSLLAVRASTYSFTRLNWLPTSRTRRSSNPLSGLRSPRASSGLCWRSTARRTWPPSLWRVCTCRTCPQTWLPFLATPS